MNITDLQEGQHINHPIKGNGIIQKITARTIKTKYLKSTTTITIRTKTTEFNLSDL